VTGPLVQNGRDVGFVVRKVRDVESVLGCQARVSSMLGEASFVNWIGETSFVIFWFFDLYF
jgi:hypothetical protein